MFAFFCSFRPGSLGFMANKLKERNIIHIYYVVTYNVRLIFFYKVAHRYISCTSIKKHMYCAGDLTDHL